MVLLSNLKLSSLSFSTFSELCFCPFKYADSSNSSNLAVLNFNLAISPLTNVLIILFWVSPAKFALSEPDSTFPRVNTIPSSPRAFGLAFRMTSRPFKLFSIFFSGKIWSSFDNNFWIAERSLGPSFTSLWTPCPTQKDTHNYFHARRCVIPAKIFRIFFLRT